MLRVLQFFKLDVSPSYSPMLPCIKYEKVSWLKAVLVRTFGRRIESEWAPQWVVYREFAGNLYEEYILRTRKE